jgi:hypothetical protein
MSCLGWVGSRYLVQWKPDPRIGRLGYSQQGPNRILMHCRTVSRCSPGARIPNSQSGWLVARSGMSTRAEETEELLLLPQI